MLLQIIFYTVSKQVQKYMGRKNKSSFSAGMSTQKTLILLENLIHSENTADISNQFRKDDLLNRWHLMIQTAKYVSI